MRVNRHEHYQKYPNRKMAFSISLTKIIEKKTRYSLRIHFVLGSRNSNPSVDVALQSQLSQSNQTQQQHHWRDNFAKNHNNKQNN